MKPELEKTISSLSFQELVESKDKIQAILDEQNEEEKNRLSEVFKELATKSGMSVDDIFKILNQGNKEKKTDKRASPKPKYYNPKDKSQTWSGRGKKPIWVREYLDDNEWQNGDDKEEMKTILEKILINQD